MKILVINPYVTDFKLYDEWMHPLGLYFLMDILRKNGHSISYFNCLQSYSSSPRKHGTASFNFTEISKPALYSNIKRKYKLYGKPIGEFRDFLERTPGPDLICIGSMMTYWAPGVLETIKIIREKWPTIPVVVGGIASRLIPQFFKRHFDKNCFIGELSDPMTLTLLEIKERPEPSFLTAFKELRKPINHGPALLSLGCPMRCSYCASKILQPSFHYRPVELILQEIEFLIEKFGVCDFALYDDALLYNPQKVFIPFLRKIIERKYKIRFHTPNGMHLRFITEPLLNLMTEAGFTTFRFGYESGDKKYLQDTSAKVSCNELEDKIGLIKKYCSDKDTGVYMMGGLRNQTPQQMLNEMDYVGSMGIKVKPVFISPVPGTSLYQYYLKQFPLLERDPLWHNDSYFITFLPDWSADAIEAVRERAKNINYCL